MTPPHHKRYQIVTCWGRRGFSTINLGFPSPRCDSFACWRIHRGGYELHQSKWFLNEFSIIFIHIKEPKGRTLFMTDRLKFLCILYLISLKAQIFLQNKTFVKCAIPENQEEFDKPGFSSTLKATAEIFSVVFERRTRILFSTSRTCPYNSNLSTKFCIAIPQNASWPPKMFFRTVRFLPFL